MTTTAEPLTSSEALEVLAGVSETLAHLSRLLRASANQVIAAERIFERARLDRAVRCAGDTGLGDHHLVGGAGGHIVSDISVLVTDLEKAMRTVTEFDVAHAAEAVENLELAVDNLRGDIVERERSLNRIDDDG
jgi:hypothetical protein